MNVHSKRRKLGGWRIVLLLTALLGPLRFAHARDGAGHLSTCIHDVWRKRDGLPGNMILDVLQTRDGYLWLATDRGLVRFDGVRFTRFDRRNTPEFGNNGISTLLEDREGTLWVGSSSGGLLRYRDGRFSAVPQLGEKVVVALHEDARGRIWIGTYGSGLFRYDAGEFRHFTAKDGLPERSILAIAEDLRGSVWLGLLHGVMIFDGERFSPLPGVTVPINAIVPDRKGRVWIGGRKGAFRCEGEGCTPVAPLPEVTGGEILPRMIDREGNLWFAAAGGHVVHYDGRTFVSSKVSPDAARIRDIFEDREGSLWMATMRDGLHRFRSGLLTFHTVEDGLPAGDLSAIHVDGTGTAWITSQQGVLIRFRDGGFTPYPIDCGDGPPTLLAIIGDSRGRLWIGTQAGRLIRFEGGKATCLRDPALEGHAITSLLWDREETLWIGTYRGGLVRGRDGVFTPYGKGAGLPDPRILTLLEDRRGGLWVGTLGGGLCHFEGERCTTNFSHATGLANDIVFSLHQDATGVLWIGTAGGVSRLSDEGIASITTRQGLDSEEIYQILEDDRGNLWMAGEAGISRVAKREIEELLQGQREEIEARHYDPGNTLGDLSLSYGIAPAGARMPDGRLLFPARDRLVSVDPTFEPPLRSFPVVIESIVGDGIAGGEDTRFRPGKGTFEFHYTALTFLEPESLHFRYRLEGFDSGWHEAGSRRVAYYTNLPPGSYRFRVRALAADGRSNEAAASFVLEPHFYQRIWFHALLLLLAAALVRAFLHYRLRRFQREEAQLRQRIEEAVAEIKVLRGLLPICAGCKQIRAEDGQWTRIEEYIQTHSEATFTHGMCPECYEKWYPGRRRKSKREETKSPQP